MKKVVKIYKPIGQTPLQAINEFRQNNPEYKDIKIGIAGRLDPLAYGVLLLMIGAETKNRDKYLSLDKEYEFEVLFGISTDTYDVLGLINNVTIGQLNNFFSSSQNLKKKIKLFIKSKLGKQTQAYPSYSSKEVLGKPLFQWAREGRLGEIEIPDKKVEIYKFELLDIKNVATLKIRKKMFENIGKVSGDFRQEEIIKKWEDFFQNNKDQVFITARFRISCSSGTYVRSLANEMGEKFGSGAIAIDILRTKVGDNKF